MLLVLTSCGYFLSGSWSNDPENWGRAFGEAKPASGISVIHSWYMRSPHFTAEYAWFFELRLSEKVKKELISKPEFTRLNNITLNTLRRRTYQDPPRWFLPQPLSAFEVYESKNDNNFLVFVEKNGNRSFWTCFQL